MDYLIGFPLRNIIGHSPALIPTSLFIMTIGTQSMDGDWECESQLGSGGFGIVHVWRNKRFHFILQSISLCSTHSRK